MGQAKKKRDCPALAKPITPAECGEKRASIHPCPASCPFNPWAPENYEQTLDIYDRMVGKSIAAFAGRYGAKALHQPAPQASDFSGADLKVVEGHNAMYNMHRRVRADGLTFAQEWERDGFKPMNNDERFLFKAHTGLRVALIEVHRFINEHSTEVVDLLDPARKPFVISDYALTRNAVRFTVLLCWLYELPHYTRMFASAKPVPSQISREPEDLIARLAAHLGGPAPSPDTTALRAWLLDNLPLIHCAINALHLAERQQQLEGMDASYCRGVYALHLPLAAFHKRMDQMPCTFHHEAEDDAEEAGYTDAWDWDASPEDEDAAMGGMGPAPRIHPEAVPQLGSIWAREGQVCATTRSEVLYRRLRKALEDEFGDSVRFVAEQIDDQAAQAGAKSRTPAWNPALLPPDLVEPRRRIALLSYRMPAGAGASKEHLLRTAADHGLDDFMDQPLPTLGGKTPREAAADPALRPALIRIAKSRIRHVDEANREHGGHADINPILRELGLHELDFAPPPELPPDEDDAFVDGDDTFDERMDDEYASMDEIIEEFEDRVGSYEEIVENAKETAAEFRRKHRELADYVEEAPFLSSLVEEDAALCILMAAHAWFFYFPSHRKAPAIDLHKLDLLTLETADFVRENGIQKLMDSCANPGLVVFLANCAQEALDSDADERRKAMVFIYLSALLSMLVNYAHDLANP